MSSFSASFTYVKVETQRRPEERHKYNTETENRPTLLGTID